ncbi:hypothetical protein ACIOJE_08030 [Kitasatospora sp. NPDC087861]|uniref:hypothetical protein n=1 Tax=Kitasatospora sp. NPDC087861 TaxID=3364070 RepID=UPI0037F37FB2
MSEQHSVQRPPVAPARVTGRSADGTWMLAVLCPYCPAEHRHGGGDGKRADMTGTRAPHCQGAVRLPHYEIAPEESRTNWDREQSYAASLLRAAEEEAREAARRESAPGPATNQRNHELRALTDATGQRGRTGRNSAYLAAWQAKNKRSGR